MIRACPGAKFAVADYHLIQAAFDIYTGLGDFLYESDISNYAGEVLTDKPPQDSLSVVLVLGVIATGRHVLESQVATLRSNQRESQQVFADACTRITPFLLGHNSLLKLQVRCFRITIGQYLITKGDPLTDSDNTCKLVLL
jgi:hypothetical protein